VDQLVRNIRYTPTRWQTIRPGACLHFQALARAELYPGFWYHAAVCQIAARMKRHPIAVFPDKPKQETSGPGSALAVGRFIPFPPSRTLGSSCYFSVRRTLAKKLGTDPATTVRIARAMEFRELQKRIPDCIFTSCRFLPRGNLAGKPCGPAPAGKFPRPSLIGKASLGSMNSRTCRAPL